MIRLVLFFLPLLFLFSCSHSNYKSSVAQGSRSTITGMAYNEEYGFIDNHCSIGSDKSVNVSNEQRKVVYDAYIDVTIKKIDSFHLQLTNLSKKYEGYAMEMGDKHAKIRVPADKLNEALKEVGSLGKLTSQTIRGDDVTDEYADVALRLDNAMRARKRYLELLEKASTVEETLIVEKELERLGLDIEIMEGKMKKMDHLISYSTIHIDIQKKRVLGPLGYIGVGVYKVVRFLFVIK